SFALGTSAFNIVTDIWILYLPIRTLWSIHRPRREKVAIVLIFGMGTFSCVASIVRLHTIYRYTLSTQPFRDAIPVNLWSMIEINVAIVCASLPALKQLLALTLKNIPGTSQASRSTGARGSENRNRITPQGIS